MARESRTMPGHERHAPSLRALAARDRDPRGSGARADCRRWHRRAAASLNFVNANTTYAADDAWILFSYTGARGRLVRRDGARHGTEQWADHLQRQAPVPRPAATSATSSRSPIWPTASRSPPRRRRASTCRWGRRSIDAAAARRRRIRSRSSAAPSPTDPSDPNWNIRWDFFETTLSAPRSRQRLRRHLGDQPARDPAPDRTLQLGHRADPGEPAPVGAHGAESARRSPSSCGRWPTRTSRTTTTPDCPGDWHFETPGGIADPRESLPRHVPATGRSGERGNESRVDRSVPVDERLRGLRRATDASRRSRRR